MVEREREMETKKRERKQSPGEERNEERRMRPRQINIEGYLVGLYCFIILRIIEVNWTLVTA